VNKREAMKLARDIAASWIDSNLAGGCVGSALEMRGVFVDCADESKVREELEAIRERLER